MINVVVSLVKMKVVAVLLGPAGVGLAGLYFILIQTASSIAALGIGNVGTKQIASAHADGGDEAVGRTRRALFWGTMALALIGAALFWLASGWIARVILADESRTTDVAWLSLGVALTVAAGSQAALLTGLRRIGDLARINVASVFLGGALGVLALWLWGVQGIITMVLISPIATLLLGHFFVARLGPPAGPPISLAELSREWRSMMTLGFAFMLSGFFTTMGHLAVRTMVQRDLGLEALGHFQAAWSIGITYLGFVLGAMSTDYYPRLAAAMRDQRNACRLINEQTEVALLLCGPVVIATIGLAPWIIQLLYSEAFGPAVEILRWQLLGDILKLLTWPIGFVILARGAGKTFFLVESLGISVFVLGVLIGIPLIGLQATGVAYFALYAFQLPLLFWLVGRWIGFRWTRAVKTQVLILFVTAVAVAITARWSEISSSAFGVSMAIATGFWAVRRISAMTERGKLLKRLASIAEKVQKWTRKR